MLAQGIDAVVQRSAQFDAKAIDLGGIFRGKQSAKQRLNGIFQAFTRVRTTYRSEQ
ncbi:MAG: hypothetical protein WA477_02065 [Candidatus Sulfotelmatobacter sp.]